MELPHVGTHCSEDNCRRLDFLPVKCDGCSKVFCGEHYSYSLHDCPGVHRKNVQVPVCPLCNAPVPGKPSELPDIRVSRHIDADCKSDTAMNRRQKVYTNKCTSKGCKQKEMIPILCDKCNLNYCLKHRHPQDHTCSNLTGKSVPKPGQAAINRHQSTTSNSRSNSFASSVSNAASSMSNGLGRVLGYRPAALQGNMSEEEALRLALQASLNGDAAVSPQSHQTNLSQEQEDFLLAKALAESEREANSAAASNVGRRSHPNCKIS